MMYMNLRLLPYYVIEHSEAVGPQLIVCGSRLHDPWLCDPQLCDPQLHDPWLCNARLCDSRL